MMGHLTDMQQFKIIVLVNGDKVTKYVRAETLEAAKKILIDMGYQLCNTCNG